MLRFVKMLASVWPFVVMLFIDDDWMLWLVDEFSVVAPRLPEMVSVEVLLPV